ncbi:nodulation protein [Thermocladium modestius]|uniref:Nodulation protein n=1 Tax=Thermocladium modestius TaxID=62609 RepID=A0A830GTR9_9CREN|nr:phosphoadenosine phosphosulfate reductase family protein [Thermocladium modestius]GGP19251.1 nodulation protein [Thermocladium modestius]
MLSISGELARRIIEEADARGLDPQQYLSILLSKASPQRRLDLLPLKYKAEIAVAVARAALETFKKAAVVWSAGKDSTVVLHAALKAREATGRDFDVVFIDHFMHFEETLKFIEDVERQWGLKVIFKGNERLRGYKYGDEVKVDELDPRDREELLKIGYTAPSFKYALNNVAANHLLKTVPMNEFIRDGGYEGVFVGIRWDENPARAGEVFFSRRQEPLHVRVHPILPFTERDVWNYTLENKLPINPLYYRGFRSIDDKYESKPTGDKPAWEQDLEGTPERVGRAQDKEGIMELLRRYGYM